MKEITVWLWVAQKRRCEVLRGRWGEHLYEMAAENTVFDITVVLSFAAAEIEAEREWEGERECGKHNNNNRDARWDNVDAEADPWAYASVFFLDLQLKSGNDGV